MTRSAASIHRDSEPWHAEPSQPAAEHVSAWPKCVPWPDDRSDYDRAEPTEADDEREALAELLNATEERESV